MATPVDSRSSEAIAMEEPSVPGSEKPRGKSDTTSDAVNISGEVHRMTADNAKEEAQSTNSLTRSKDNAQVTATSALSLSLITVLKELISDGPEENRYYLASIALVCTSLLLQVVIGILAIMMYTMSQKTSKIGKKDADSNKAGGVEVAVFGVASSVNNYGTLTHGDNIDELGGLRSTHLASDIHHALEELSRRLLEDPSIAALTPISCMGKLKAWCSGQESADSMTATENILLDFQQQMKRHELIALMHVSALQINDTNNHQEILEEAKIRLQILQSHDKLIKTQTDSISKKRMLGLVEKLQSAVTYTYYVVFVINAFITGFGFSS